MELSYDIVHGAQDHYTALLCCHFWEHEAERRSLKDNAG